MRATCFLIALAVAVSTASHADSSATTTRDNALRGIEACLRRNEASSRECKSFNKNVGTLEALYRQGDKTVLPTLLQFTYSTDFYGEALVSDPDGFLTAVSYLPERGQEAVATGIAGGMWGLTQAGFDGIRATLMKVPDSSSNYQLARACLLTLETENASFIVNYFPPQMFTGRSGDFEVHWFSRELYVLGEKPIWPPASGNERTYRITVLPAFRARESVTLTVMPNDTGQIEFRTSDAHSHRLNVDGPQAITPQQVADFTSALNRIQFWQLPTEIPPRGFDGAEWILEGVQDGRYHLVHRWCPGKTPFGKAARDLFDLAGHKSSGGC